MKDAVLVIDVQQGLCEGSGAAFDCEGTITRISAGNGAISAPQVIAHHNATLTNISSFGPRAQAIASDSVEFAA